MDVVRHGLAARRQAERKADSRRHDQNAGVAMREIEKFTDHGGHMGAG